MNIPQKFPHGFAPNKGEGEIGVQNTVKQVRVDSGFQTGGSPLFSDEALSFHILIGSFVDTIYTNFVCLREMVLKRSGGSRS